MFWVIVLPFKITCLVMLGFIALMTLLAPLIRWPSSFRWKRLPTLFCSIIVAGFLFIPVCAGIMSFIDSNRFGVFEYATFDQIQDPHVNWAIPPSATDITLEKYGQGHRAKYKIPEPELRSFIDQQWTNFSRPVVTKEEWYERGVASPEMLELNFGHLSWPTLEEPLELNGPMASDGAGVTYYLDRDTNTVYHRASYF